MMDYSLQDDFCQRRDDASCKKSPEKREWGRAFHFLVLVLLTLHRERRSFRTVSSQLNWRQRRSYPAPLLSSPHISSSQNKMKRTLKTIFLPASEERRYSLRSLRLWWCCCSLFFFRTTCGRGRTSSSVLLQVQWMWAAGWWGWDKKREERERRQGTKSMGG